MIHPAPTTKIDPRLARGTLVELTPATATKPEFVRISFPNTQYQIHLLPETPVGVEPGARIIGTIHAQVARIDKVNAGGRYFEPVLGRPRRVQGRVIAVNGETNEVIVNAGVPIHCHPTDKRQKATDFHDGDFVTCGVLEGATFRAQG
ncbi:MAG: hypothetical protein IPJ41_12600 [Phycisphaerales bacterium]|nr:hypothetical protein [Phycisphaerales bacterium]